MSNIYLILYIVIWIVTLFFYQKKKRNFDAGSVIILSYLVYSIASLILYNSINGSDYNNIKLFPFIYLYLMLMLIMMPIIKYNDRKIKLIQKPSNILFNTISIIYIISSLINLFSSLSNVFDGLVKIMMDTSGGLEIYNQTMENSFNLGDGNISNLFAIFSNLLSDIGILLFFYYLTLEKRNKYILFGLFLSFTGGIFSYIAISQRGPAIEQLLTIIIAYFVFRKFISTRINKIIQRIGITIFFLISIPMIAITISRFGEDEIGTSGSLYSYIGQENLNFNNYGLDNGGIRYGDRTFPLFKRILGFDNVPENFWQRRIKYPNLKINDEVFIGFIGDFTLDFGPLIAPLIFILFTIIVIYRTRTRNDTILFHQLILLYFVICVCFQGGMKLYSFSDTGGNLKLITYMLLYLSFKLDYKNNLSKSTKINNNIKV